MAATPAGARHRPGLLSGPVAPLVVGVVNATPDSFSDRHPSPALAVDHGRALLAAGADLLDVGGESTRPGAGRVAPEEELARVLPVVRALAAGGAEVSVDTTRAEVAAQALDAGASWVNDVSGGLADPAMLALVAATGSRCVLMHWRGPSADMQQQVSYDDVVAEVLAHLQARHAAALAAGVQPDRVLLDPGLGFAKTGEHNWALLRALPHLVATLPAPVFIGASRKGFLGALLPGPDGSARAADGRDVASAEVSVWAARCGAAAVRVHDVRATRDALAVAGRLGGLDPVPA